MGGVDVPFARHFGQKTAPESTTEQSVNLLITGAYPSLRSFVVYPLFGVFRTYRHQTRRELALDRDGRADVVHYSRDIDITA